MKVNSWVPELATAHYDWQSWVDPYIVESKRLLTVRRNVRPFHLLQGWGCETILRKGGIEITLAEYDLDGANAGTVDGCPQCRAQSELFQGDAVPHV